MSLESFALLERLHGHLAVLGLAVLLHPCITLRRRRALTRWTVRTADLGALLLAVPFAIGWWIYPTYRSVVKPTLWSEAPSSALWFESKEHLAVMTVALAVGGALTLRVAGRHPEGRRAAWVLLCAAWLTGLLTGAIGLFVSAVTQGVSAGS